MIGPSSPQALQEGGGLGTDGSPVQGWRREADAAPGSPVQGWKREADANPGSPVQGWKREAEAAPGSPVQGWNATPTQRPDHRSRVGDANLKPLLDPQRKAGSVRLNLGLPFKVGGARRKQGPLFKAGSVKQNRRLARLFRDGNAPTKALVASGEDSTFSAPENVADQRFKQNHHLRLAAHLFAVPFIRRSLKTLFLPRIVFLLSLLYVGGYYSIFTEFPFVVLSSNSTSTSDPFVSLGRPLAICLLPLF